eukprot:1237394-Pyramimonas_sp.AAC.1
MGLAELVPEARCHGHRSVLTLLAKLHLPLPVLLVLERCLELRIHCRQLVTEALDAHLPA